jgi:hypothetical protein
MGADGGDSVTGRASDKKHEIRFGMERMISWSLESISLPMPRLPIAFARDKTRIFYGYQ